MGAILLFLVLLVWGMICSISPESAWHMSEGWRFKDAEPSEAALKYLRIIGIVQIAAAFYILFTM